jgi:hypothetical protein
MVRNPMLTQMVSKHRTNGLLLDTNLLLLWVIGSYDRRRIENFKRTAAYTRDDFQKLGWLILQFKQLWTTPNILTEVNNLGRQLPSNEWKGFASAFSSLSLVMKEKFVPASVAVKSQRFAELGLADTVTLEIETNCLLLSDDFKLCLYAQKNGVDAVNFNHLRF